MGEVPTGKIPWVQDLEEWLAPFLGALDHKLRRPSLYAACSGRGKEHHPADGVLGGSGSARAVAPWGYLTLRHSSTVGPLAREGQRLVGRGTRSYR